MYSYGSITQCYCNQRRVDVYLALQTVAELTVSEARVACRLLDVLVR
jgi:hypothetical protein